MPQQKTIEALSPVDSLEPSDLIFLRRPGDPVGDRDKRTLAANALFPVGFIAEFSGIFAPEGWVFGRGQAISRTTYEALFNIYTATSTATTTSGNSTLTAVANDYSAATLGVSLVGAKIEGTGIQAGTTISAITDTTITLSLPATASATGVEIRIFPYGNGDGSTTFNVIDLVGASPVGAGTSTGYTANETFALGTKYNDQMQQITGQFDAAIHASSTVAMIQAVSGAVSRVNTTSAYPGSISGSLTLPSGFRFNSANSPNARTGTTTRGKVVGVNYIIKV